MVYFKFISIFTVFAYLLSLRTTGSLCFPQLPFWLWSSVDLGTVFPPKSTAFSPSSLLSHNCRSLSSCCLSFIVLSVEMAVLMNCFQSFRFLAFLRTFIFESVSLRVTLIDNRDGNITELFSIFQVFGLPKDLHFWICVLEGHLDWSWFLFSIRS